MSPTIVTTNLTLDGGSLKQPWSVQPENVTMVTGADAVDMMYMTLKSGYKLAAWLGVSKVTGSQLKNTTNDLGFLSHLMKMRNEAVDAAVLRCVQAQIDQLCRTYIWCSLAMAHQLPRARFRAPVVS